MKMALTVLTMLVLGAAGVAEAKRCAISSPNSCAGEEVLAGCTVSGTGRAGICKSRGKPDPNFGDYACVCTPAPERPVQCDYGSSDIGCTGKPGFSSCQSSDGRAGRCAPIRGPGQFGDYACSCQ